MLKLVLTMYVLLIQIEVLAAGNREHSGSYKIGLVIGVIIVLSELFKK